MAWGVAPLLEEVEVELRPAPRSAAAFWAMPLRVATAGVSFSAPRFERLRSMRLLPDLESEPASRGPGGPDVLFCCWREERVVILREFAPLAGAAALLLVLGGHESPDEGAGRTRGVVGVCPCAAANNVVAAKNIIQIKVAVGRIVKQPIINLSKKRYSYSVHQSVSLRGCPVYLNTSAYSTLT